jgi:hypothetical protein
MSNTWFRILFFAFALQEARREAVLVSH